MNGFRRHAVILRDLALLGLLVQILLVAMHGVPLGRTDDGRILICTAQGLVLIERDGDGSAPRSPAERMDCLSVCLGAVALAAGMGLLLLWPATRRWAAAWRARPDVALRWHPALGSYHRRAPPA